MITTNAYYRVFKIRSGVASGTGYLREFHGAQHMVTAAHLFSGISEPKNVEIFMNNQWRPFPVVVAFVLLAADTIVLKLPGNLRSGLLPVVFGTEGVINSAMSYILGFPFGINLDPAAGFGPVPTPFVKGGIISAMVNHNGVTEIFIDGHNNKGFSGGPVVYYPPGHCMTKVFDPVIIGTVSSFLAEHPGVVATGEEADAFSVNAGMIKAYGIDDLDARVPKV